VCRPKDVKDFLRNVILPAVRRHDHQVCIGCRIQPEAYLHGQPRLQGNVPRYRGADSEIELGYPGAAFGPIDAEHFKSGTELKD
jgi:hypothetical protein